MQLYEFFATTSNLNSINLGPFCIFASRRFTHTHTLTCHCVHGRVRVNRVPSLCALRVAMPLFCIFAYTPGIDRRTYIPLFTTDEERCWWWITKTKRGRPNKNERQHISLCMERGVVAITLTVFTYVNTQNPTENRIEQHKKNGIYLVCALRMKCKWTAITCTARHMLSCVYTAHNDRT